MRIADLINILTNRIASLNAQKVHATSVGDLQRVLTLDEEITETETTLNQLKGI